MACKTHLTNKSIPGHKKRPKMRKTGNWQRREEEMRRLKEAFRDLDIEARRAFSRNPRT